MSSRIQGPNKTRGPRKSGTEAAVDDGDTRVVDESAAVLDSLWRDFKASHDDALRERLILGPCVLERLYQQPC